MPFQSAYIEQWFICWILPSNRSKVNNIILYYWPGCRWLSICAILWCDEIYFNLFVWSLNYCDIIMVELWILTIGKSTMENITIFILWTNNLKFRKSIIFLCIRLHGMCLPFICWNFYSLHSGLNLSHG